ncbi:MAG: flagellin [Humidesulfovibrio sp.]|uniref:flagellin N-terminal helical domain-containing protein n=1 Tax=Humidesulfovibrio sp. TaxID=2910988 RepID=UPI0027FD24CA|nr:flagellin [Humidesulfovibrio sp.]
MPLTINHNLMATKTARLLADSYGKLAVSTRRLSSGLRIQTAGDDSAGLAVREILRSEIRSLQQGIRNANDAISMIQTADGALGVIDEKLIRMKELAMQAATGTYSSDQRLIIDSEYQAMASEITRIAKSTDFNGIHLLNGNLSGATSTHNGAGLQATGPMKVHFGTGNDSAEDYYYVQIGNVTASALGLSGSSGGSGGGSVDSATYYAQQTTQYATANNLTANGFSNTISFLQNNLLIAGTQMPANVYNEFDPTATVTGYRTQDNLTEYDFAVDRSGNLRAITWGTTLVNYVSNITVAGPPSSGSSSGSSSGPSISTQQLAQQALATISNAIISKDKIRANLGAMQNRLQNTITNLSIQAENTQAAESQVSDVDVATEMTEFTRQQILTQSAVAMLSQANGLGRLAMQLIGG